MTNFIKVILIAIFGAIIDALLKAIKKPAEQVQKEKDDEKVKNNLDAVNSDSPGYKLPPDAANDQWGDTITKT